MNNFFVQGALWLGGALFVLLVAFAVGTVIFIPYKPH